MSSLLQAAMIDELLEEQGEELPAAVRERMAGIAEALRSRRRDELNPPNIPVDEPIPGTHPRADEARALSPTGDLPRSDRTPAPAPEEIVPPHEFVTATTRRRRSSVMEDLTPDEGAPVLAEGGGWQRSQPPPQVPVERALPGL